jgi:Domain of unknown function (DUF4328)
VLDVTDADLCDPTRPDRGSAPSRLLANALTGLLIADVIGAAMRLGLPPLLSSHEKYMQVAINLKPIVVLSRILLATTVALFLIWFYDARVRAESSSWMPRRARAWAFWGWLIPIADLWIPFQIMADIWHAHLPPHQRGKVAWLPGIWWASWLLTAFLSSHQSGSPTSYGLQLAHDWSSFFVFAVAASTLMIIIQTVTRQRHGTEWRSDAIPSTLGF